jgi:phage tail-like protein
VTEARERVATAAFFKVEIQDAVIGHFSKCQGIGFSYEVFEYKEGGLNTFSHQFRDRVSYPRLVLTRGITDDQALTKWFFETKNPDARGHVIVSLLTRRSEQVRRWAFAAAFPVKWDGPVLDSAGGQLALEVLEIAHQGLVQS